MNLTEKPVDDAAHDGSSAEISAHRSPSCLSAVTAKPHVSPKPSTGQMHLIPRGGRNSLSVVADAVARRAPRRAAGTLT